MGNQIIGRDTIANLAIINRVIREYYAKEDDVMK
jgi:hypothetical protein